MLYVICYRLCILWAVGATLGVYWEDFGASWVDFGAILGSVLAILGPHWEGLGGTFLSACGGIFDSILVRWFEDNLEMIASECQIAS